MDGDQEDQTMEEWESDNWGSGETSVSGEGKLVGKLKIGRNEGGMEEDQIESPAKKVQAWICEVCDREFSSGKALGGHMRVHGQASKELAYKKLKNQYQDQQDEEEADRRDRGGDGSSSRQRLICSICGKDFPSIKSLSGHMRCHPGREWRGIHPPPPPGSDDPSAGVDRPPVPTDLRSRLSSTWSATARRGRNALFAAARPPQSSESEEEEFEQQGREAVAAAAAIIRWSWEREEEEFYGAVIALTRLSLGKSEPIQRHTVVEFEATNSNSPTNRAEIEDNINGHPESEKLIIDNNPIDKIKGKSVLETGSVSDNTSRDDNDHDHDDDDDHQFDMNGSFCSDTTTINSMIKNKKRKKKFRDLDSVQGGTGTSTLDHHHHHHQFQNQSQTQNQKANVMYKCSTCNKCFTNHQALGGHRSSHHKRRNLHGTTPEESSPPTAGVERCPNSAAVWAKAPKESQGEPTHQCKICSKTFPSGQALGGHQRSHWAAPSSQVTSPGESDQTGAQKVLLGFDLNELPTAAMESEDGTDDQSEQATGCCYPSSSHSSAA